MNERFTKAIDQLGAVLPGAAAEKSGEMKINLGVRLGGIYALEQISKDLPAGYQWTVIEVLSSYVRENAPSKKSVFRLLKADQDIETHPRADVQAALTVLGRLNICNDSGHGQHPCAGDHLSINLSRSDLRGADLRNADLRRANLSFANLEGAHLEGANLSEAEELSTDQLQRTFGDRETKLPEVFRRYRPVSWPP